jgi:hypothetical protein
MGKGQPVTSATFPSNTTQGEIYSKLSKDALLQPKRYMDFFTMSENRIYFVYKEDNTLPPGHYITLRNTFKLVIY